MVRGLSWWACGSALAACALASLSWHMTVDEPLLAYTAMAIDRMGLVPYRDLFDFNMPGAYLANIAIGRVFGYSEFGFRLADITCLAVLLVTTATALRNFGQGIRAAAALLFGFLYLGYGPVMSLQREYLLLLPLSGCIALALSKARWWTRVTGIGMLLGIGAAIKPQAAILLPVFIGWLAWIKPARSLWTFAVAVTAFAIPLGACAAWLWSIGAWPAFADMASNYWPLYNELTGVKPIRIINGLDRWWWNGQRFFLSRDIRHLLVIPAVAGAWFALSRSLLREERRQEVVLLVAIFVALQMYPLVAGKFWGYHWLPAMYGASLLAALCFLPTNRGRPSRDFAAAMVIVMITALTPGLMELTRRLRFITAVHASTATEIADAMRPALRPGDTVQPLDWAGGAVHALFLTRTRIATPFLYDFHFYHHVSHRYIQSMRERLLRSLDAARPALIVDAHRSEEFAGPDTSNQFPELAEWLRAHYRAVEANDRFVIYEGAWRLAK